MSDAVGGTVTLAIISFFIVIVLGYIAFNINYTKAFRMKDYIVTKYDDYQGNCNSSCQSEISDYAKELGYKVASFSCSEPEADFVGDKGYYCIAEHTPTKQTLDTDTQYHDITDKKYYTIETKIDIKIPVVDNVLGALGASLTIKGNTRVYSK